MTFIAKENYSYRFALQVMLLFYIFSVVGAAFFTTPAKNKIGEEQKFVKVQDYKTHPPYLKILKLPVVKAKTNPVVKSALFPCFFGLKVQFPVISLTDRNTFITSSCLSFCRFSIIAKGP